jgi:hypothetical protein
MKHWLMVATVLGFVSVTAQAQDSPAPPAGGNANARAACRGDYQKLCKGVKVGGARDCLAAHMDELSAACKDVIQKSLQQPANPSADAPKQ